MDEKKVYSATGKRKSAIARIWLRPGNGEIIINNRPMSDYFRVEAAEAVVTQPLVITNTLESFDIKVQAIGGGVSGQAAAVRHGITKALMIVNPDFRQPLKKAGFVRRDPRVKERKKYGQKGARARFQFSKR